MAIAITGASRLQDLTDVNVTPAVGEDEKVLVYDHDTQKFVLKASAAGVTDHGALTGLTDDDHTQYALLAGRAGGTTIYGGTAANDDITIHGTSNATRATSYVLLQPTAGNVGIGTTAPANKLDVNGYIGCTRIVNYNTATDIIRVDGTTVRLYAQSNGMAVTSAVTGATLFSVSLAGVLAGFLTNATTNAVDDLLTLAHRSSGTPTANFGSGIALKLQSSTANDISAALISALWNDATHATRKADLVLSAYDTAVREGLRIRGNGSAAAVGFLGATPAARIAHVADPAGGATVDAEARTAINSILAALETFGFLATS